MKIEFVAVFKDLFRNAFDLLKKQLFHKIEVIRKIELVNAMNNSQNNAQAMQAKIAYGFLGDIQRNISNLNSSTAFKSPTDNSILHDSGGVVKNLNRIGTLQ